MDRFAELEEQLRFLQLEIELERKARERERLQQESQVRSPSRSPSNNSHPVGLPVPLAASSQRRQMSPPQPSPMGRGYRDMLIYEPLCRTSDALYVTPPSKTVLSPARPQESTPTASAKKVATSAAAGKREASGSRVTPVRRDSSATRRTPVSAAKSSGKQTVLLRHRADGTVEDVAAEQPPAQHPPSPAPRPTAAAKNQTPTRRVTSASPRTARSPATPSAQVVRGTTPSPRPGRTTPSRTRVAPSIIPPLSVAHAWTKFVRMVSGALTEDEIALISAETLTSLLDSFYVTDSEERAQIEAHWSLLQNVVQQDATSLPSVAEALHRGKAFDLRPEPLKPKLSKRVALDPQRTTPRTSNPHDALGADNSRKEGRNVTPLRSIVPVGSNPNEVETSEMYRKPCFHRVASANSPTTPRAEGIATFAPKVSEDQVNRGLRAWGGPSEVTFDVPVKKESLRTDVVAPRTSLLGPMESPRDTLPRRGVRTYGQTMSSRGDEGAEARISRLGSASASNRRDTLTTETIVSLPSRNPTTSTPLSPRQARTPFAVDA